MFNFLLYGKFLTNGPLISKIAEITQHSRVIDVSNPDPDEINSWH
jgi:hypothetical protein